MEESPKPAAEAAPPTAVAPTNSSKSKRRRRPRVIVVGAGMSGLACARELENRNYDVLVLEGRRRAGGRLKGGELLVPTGARGSNNKKQQDGTHPVDLGGALIHGIDGNPLYSLTEDLGVPTSSVQDCLLMNESGWPVDPKEDAAVQAVFNECLEESFQRAGAGRGNSSRSLDMNAPRTTRSSVLSAEKSSFGDLFEQVCEEKSVQNTALLRWHQSNLEVSCGAGMDQLGWQWNEDEPYGFDGDHNALQLSWKAVVESLADGLKNIWYDAPVSRIQVINPPPGSENESDKKRKKDGNPQSQQAKQRYPSRGAFSLSRSLPTDDVLPTRQSRRLRGEDAAVRRSGRANKGSAAERFTVSHATRTSERKKKRPRAETAAQQLQNSVVQVTVQQSTKEPVVLEADAVVCTLPLGILKLAAEESGGVVFEPPLDLDKQRAIERLGTGLLNKCIFSFSRVFWQDSDFMGLADEEHSYLVLNGMAYTGKPILIFMFGGNFAKEIEEWTDERIVEDCLSTLKRICGHYLPPLDYQVTRWGHEHFSRMSFTYIPPGVDGFAELRTMSQPIYDYKEEIPVLMFAGEHTTPYHPSTIHGAYLSGIREAYRLDCTLSPEAVGNLQFSEEELYQRTFTVEQKFNGEPAVALVNRARSASVQKKSPSAKRRQHRRRGAAGVMKLRELPRKKVVQIGDSSRATKASETTVASPARRSQRSAVGQNHNRGIKDEGENGNERSSDSSLKALEDRMLQRSVESYGHDYGFIYENTIPVHGSKTSRSLAQVRHRCQQLVRSDKTGKSFRPKNALKRWTATVEAPSVVSSTGTRKGRPNGRE